MPTPPPEMLATARALMADAVTEDVTSAFRRAGIHCILLKGPTLARWLYEHVAMRPYVDSDLLVAAADVGAAEEILARLGFEHPPLDDIPHDLPWHAHAWTRSRDAASVDLHRTLIGPGVGPEEVWRVLSAETERMPLGDIEVEVLTRPARAFHVALHAVQDGGLEKPLEDLRRAVRLLPLEGWQEAARLAADLEATPAFAAGLRLLPAGASLAAQLGLPTEAPLSVSLRARGAPRSALSVEWLARTPGLRAKLSYVARKLFPPVAFMRAWSPLAQRRPLGLALSYAWRLLWLAVAAGPALRSWWRGRREAASVRSRPPRRRLTGAGRADRP